MINLTRSEIVTPLTVSGILSRNLNLYYLVWSKIINLKAIKGILNKPKQILIHKYNLTPNPSRRSEWMEARAEPGKRLMWTENRKRKKNPQITFKLQQAGGRIFSPNISFKDMTNRFKRFFVIANRGTTLKTLWSTWNFSYHFPLF